MKKVFNKFGVIGSIKTRLQVDILRHKTACLSGYASRKTKRQMKRLASQANRRFIKFLTKEEFEDLM